MRIIEAGHPHRHVITVGILAQRFHNRSLDHWRTGFGNAIVPAGERDGPRMKRASILSGLFVVGILTVALPAFAGEGRAPTWRYNAHSPEPPFPRSARAESVWASVPCWND